MSREIRFCVIGLGNIGRNLLDILVNRTAAIEDEYGLKFILAGAADSSGAAWADEGLDFETCVDIKLAGKGIATYETAGRPNASAMDLLAAVNASILVDASPTNLQDGEPGMSCCRQAIAKGWHIVAANKGPLVLAYTSLMEAAHARGTEIAFSGTVAGGLPTVNMGVRDLAGCAITRIEGIFNGTTNYILTRMLQEHISYEEALKGAQEAGIAEADPTLDVDGWDAANKLVIIANSALKRPTRLDELKVQGIRDVTLEDMLKAAENGQVIKLIALAELDGDDYKLCVKPTLLPASHPMARTDMWDMGVVYYTDYMGIISAVIEEKGPVPTSAAVLRDMINISL